MFLHVRSIPTYRYLLMVSLFTALLCFLGMDRDSCPLFFRFFAGLMAGESFVGMGWDLYKTKTKDKDN